ncbi:hypothetical protein T484DRAFT_1771294 [Baffinella frigidus]|nr:hypothetical protein T484DRAFT_1771294 [Cryptophyta sp. CCMP2293]
MSLRGARPIRAGRSKTGRYIRVDTGRHLLFLREEPTPGPTPGTAPFALTVSFADGGVFVARRAAPDAPLRAALSLPDGLHITVDEAGVVWQSRPDALGRGGLAWAPAEEALGGGPERGGAVALRSLAVLEDGDVAARWADGAAEALMRDGSAGFFGGGARGWEWTNSKGLRQVASPALAREPAFEEAQRRDAVRVAVSVDAGVGMETKIREDSVVAQSVPGRGERVVRHRGVVDIRTLSTPDVDIRTLSTPDGAP